MQRSSFIPVCSVFHYSTEFYTEPSLGFVESSILRNVEQNPLGTRIRIRTATTDSFTGPDGADAWQSEAAPSREDNDLKREIPCYAKVLQYLGTVLSAAIKGNQAPPSLLERFSDAQSIWDEFRRQFAMYARQEYPFRHPVSPNEPPLYYWKALTRHKDSDVLSVSNTSSNLPLETHCRI